MAEAGRETRPQTTDQYPERDKTRRGASTRSWIVLIVSRVLEAVWATALGKSEGFTKLWPSVIFGGALVLSMADLAWSMREIPIGTAYALWVGIGAALTVTWSAQSCSSRGRFFRRVDEHALAEKFVNVTPAP